MSATPPFAQTPPIPEDIRARVHRGDEHELGWERDAASGAGDGYLSVFERLAHDFERGSLELGELIEKQDAVMGEAYFPGRGNSGAAEETDVGDGVMRRTEWSRRDKRLLAIQHPGNAVDLRALDRFFERHRRHDRRDPFRQHRFSGPGRADHEQIVAAGDGDFDGALDVSLAFYVGEIDLVVLVSREERSQIAISRGDQRFPPNELESLAEIVDAVDGDSFHHRGFVRVDRRNKDRLFLLPARFQCHRQHAFHGTNAAVEREFPHEAVFFEGGAIQLLGHRDQPERDWQIEAWPFFLNIGRCEIDRRPAARPMVTAVDDRRRDPVLTFFHRGIGQTDDDYFREAMRAVDLDLDFVGVDAKNGG